MRVPARSDTQASSCLMPDAGERRAVRFVPQFRPSDNRLRPRAPSADRIDPRAARPKHSPRSHCVRRRLRRAPHHSCIQAMPICEWAWLQTGAPPTEAPCPDVVERIEWTHCPACAAWPHRSGRGRKGCIHAPFRPSHEACVNPYGAYFLAPCARSLESSQDCGKRPVLLLTIFPGSNT